ncbi:hypothetical protein LXA43DRAFT_1067256 [Ganoderma leucocontextum]|nr:hypothetical protein LXA43DRAFT_1067256 [Ganoderma leucocontextum]
MPGQHFSSGSLTGVPVRILVAQCSEHDYGIVIAKLVNNEQCSNPPEVLFGMLITHGITFDFKAAEYKVIVNPGQPSEVSIVLDNALNFWSLVSSITAAMTKVFARLNDIEELLEAITRATVLVARSVDDAASTGERLFEDNLYFTTDMH